MIYIFYNIYAILIYFDNLLSIHMLCKALDMYIVLLDQPITNACDN